MQKQTTENRPFPMASTDCPYHISPQIRFLPAGSTEHSPALLQRAVCAASIPNQIFATRSSLCSCSFLHSLGPISGSKSEISTFWEIQRRCQEGGGLVPGAGRGGCRGHDRPRRVQHHGLLRGLPGDASDEHTSSEDVRGATKQIGGKARLWGGLVPS